MSEQKIYHEFTKKIYDQQVMLRNGYTKSISPTVYTTLEMNVLVNVLRMIYNIVNLQFNNHLIVKQGYLASK